MRAFFDALEDPTQVAQQATHTVAYQRDCTACSNVKFYASGIYSGLFDTSDAYENGYIVHTFDKREWPEYENAQQYTIDSDNVYDYPKLKYIINRGTYYIPSEDSFVHANGVPVDFQAMQKNIARRLRRLIWCGHIEGKFLLSEDEEAFILRATNAFLKHVEHDYQPALDLLNTFMKGDLKLL